MWDRFTCRGSAAALLEGGPGPQQGLQQQAAGQGRQALGAIAAPFASLTLGLGGSPASRAAAVKDPRSGVTFPGEFCLREGARSCPVITGTG